jgi:hypothetical protein
MKVQRFFTREGVHPFDEVEWELRTAGISDENGKVIFEQKDVEIPKGWSQTATNIVVSKYFTGGGHAGKGAERQATHPPVTDTSWPGARTRAISPPRRTRPSSIWS